MRGVYEKPEGSGIWWIHYYAAGRRHREKVGRKSDAMKLYQARKARRDCWPKAARVARQ